MKRIIIALCLCATPAFAAEPAPPSKPPTVEELQVEIARYKAALTAAMQQRDAAQQALANAIVNEAANAAVKPKP